KDYTAEEIAAGKALIKAQLAALKKAKATGDLETVTCTSAVLALDRFYVHRIRPVTGKDGTPLNELELIAMSLLVHGGVFTTDKVIKYKPELSVLGLKPGDKVALNAADVQRLSDAVFAELAEKFS